MKMFPINLALNSFERELNRTDVLVQRDTASVDVVITR
jgi:hypothetical protein